MEKALENNEEEKIREAIIEVIVFFDVFLYPLSSLEVWQFLFLKCDYSNVIDNLKDLEENNLISANKGFYCLPGSENNVKVRLERYNYSYEKLKKLGQYPGFWLLCPG